MGGKYWACRGDFKEALTSWVFNTIWAPTISFLISNKREKFLYFTLSLISWIFCCRESRVSYCSDNGCNISIKWEVNENMVRITLILQANVQKNEEGKESSLKTFRKVLLNANFIFFQSLYDFSLKAFYNFSHFMSMKFFLFLLITTKFAKFEQH